MRDDELKCIVACVLHSLTTMALSYIRCFGIKPAFLLMTMGFPLIFYETLSNESFVIPTPDP